VALDIAPAGIPIEMIKALLLLLLTTSILVSAEPSRAGGLSVHMLRARGAKISGEHGGFTLTEPTTKAKGTTFVDPKQLFTYFPALTNQYARERQLDRDYASKLLL
jgi:hypothetical protein